MIPKANAYEKNIIQLWNSGDEYLIIKKPSGIRYSNQTGGVMCNHPVIEGVLMPISCGITDDLEEHINFYADDYNPKREWNKDRDPEVVKANLENIYDSIEAIIKKTLSASSTYKDKLSDLCAWMNSTQSGDVDIFEGKALRVILNEELDSISASVISLSDEKELTAKRYFQLEAQEKSTESINKTQLEVDLNTKLFRDNETSIEQKREAKKALIAGYKFPFENVVVDTDGVWIRVDGQLYELKWEQVATSKLYLGCYEIAIAADSNDLVLIDRGESLGMKNIEWIDDIAKTRDVLVLITVVDDSTDNVLFEIVDNK